MIDVAVFGTGGISAKHIEGYLRFPGRCRIVALSDRLPERAEEVRRRYGLDCAVHADPVALARDGDFELASICTPPATHPELAIACLDAGKNVLLEKPMAPSLAECDAILAAEARSGRLLSVVAQNRFKTPAMRLKRILDSGLLGEIHHIQVDSFWWRTDKYYETDWRGTWAGEGGGCTFIHSIHHIDLALWLVGMPYEITSVIDNLAHGNSEMEDISLSILRFRPRILGQLTSSLIHHGEEKLVAIQAERAAVAMPWKAMAMVGNAGGFPAGGDDAFLKELEALYQGLPALAHEDHAGQIDDVLTALEHSAPPLVTGRDGKNAMDVVVGIYKSAFEGKKATLPFADDDPYRTREGMLAHAVKYNNRP